MYASWIFMLKEKDICFFNGMQTLDFFLRSALDYQRLYGKSSLRIPLQILLDFTQSYFFPSTSPSSYLNSGFPLTPEISVEQGTRSLLQRYFISNYTKDCDLACILHLEIVTADFRNLSFIEIFKGKSIQKTLVLLTQEGSWTNTSEKELEEVMIFYQILLQLLGLRTSYRSHKQHQKGSQNNAAFP